MEPGKICREPAGRKLGPIVRADLLAYVGSPLSRSFLGRARQFLRAYIDRDFRLVFWLRVQRRLIENGFKPLALLIYFRMKSRYAVDLSPWAAIEPGLRLMHAYDITIGPEVRIGENCILFNGVTLGNARPDIQGNRMPIIGNRCILGTGAKILGAVRIDEDLLIGANVVVREDVTKGTPVFERMSRARQVRIRKDSAGGSAA